MQMQCNCINCILQRKRKKQEKENFPHTPLKEKEINKEKEALSIRACARKRAKRQEKYGKND